MPFISIFDLVEQPNVFAIEAEFSPAWTLRINDV
jgi:hypothetical protein